MKITQYATKYVVENGDGKLHIINRKSLVWHIKNVLKLKGNDGKAVMRQLDANGSVELTREVA